MCLCVFDCVTCLVYLCDVFMCVCVSSVFVRVFVCDCLLVCLCVVV